MCQEDPSSELQCKLQSEYNDKLKLMQCEWQSRVEELESRLNSTLNEDSLRRDAARQAVFNEVLAKLQKDKDRIIEELKNEIIMLKQSNSDFQNILNHLSQENNVDNAILQQIKNMQQERVELKQKLTDLQEPTIRRNPDMTHSITVFKK